MILAGDVGGTSTRLALFDADPGATALASATFSSASLAGLGEAIDRFLDEGHSLHGRPRAIEAASFGIAGPVIDGRAQLPNLPWSVDAAALARQLNLPRVGLLNDLEANAYGIASLTSDDVVPLTTGTDRAPANAAILSVGTGLGEAGLLWDGRMHRPIASE